MAVARFLEKNPRVEKVVYPGKTIWAAVGREGGKTTGAAVGREGGKTT